MCGQMEIIVFECLDKRGRIRLCNVMRQFDAANSNDHEFARSKIAAIFVASIVHIHSFYGNNLYRNNVTFKLLNSEITTCFGFSAGQMLVGSVWYI